MLEQSDRDEEIISRLGRMMGDRLGGRSEYGRWFGFDRL